MERFKPEMGQRYHFVNSYGMPFSISWDDDTADILRYDAGNCFPTTEQANEPGLSKREYFAAMAMQGIMARSTMLTDASWAVQFSVMVADRLINELNKETTR